MAHGECLNYKSSDSYPKHAGSRDANVGWPNNVDKQVTKRIVKVTSETLGGSRGAFLFEPPSETILSNCSGEWHVHALWLKWHISQRKDPQTLVNVTHISSLKTYRSWQRCGQPDDCKCVICILNLCYTAVKQSNVYASKHPKHTARTPLD